MKTKQKKKSAKKRVEEDYSDEDLAALVESIQDGEEVLTSTGDGDDVPTSEINDVIKQLKLDRFKDDSVKSTKKKGKESSQTKKEDSTKSQRKRKDFAKSESNNDDSLISQDSTEISVKATKNKRKKDTSQGKPEQPNEKTSKNQREHVNGDTFSSKQGLLKQKKNKKLKPQDKNNVASSSETTTSKEKISGNAKAKAVPGSITRKNEASVSLKFNKSSVQLVPAGVKWFMIQGTSKVEGKVSEDGVVKSYMEHATKLYDNEVELYAARKSNEPGSQSRWMQTVAKSGALSDKVAALTLEVQGAPVHSPVSLDNLLAMVRKKGRREALLGLDAVKRLFLEELLPSNRKLQPFSQHCYEGLEQECKNNPSSRDRQLLLWFVEDQFKLKYGSFLDTIEKMLQDTVVAIKSKALSVCYELLVNRPEQEKKLLGLIVNKVGDPDYKVAAKAVHWLQKLVEVHSMMKMIVVQSIEALLFRPNISTKAQYYAVCFLNQLVLNPEEDHLATQLILVYLSFFKACTKQKTVDNKMLSAVITGVHRAFPYSKEDEKVHEQLDALLKVVHMTSFTTSIQALLLIKQVLDKRQSTMDRFYSALYRKLLDPQLSTSPRHAMFLNLLYQTLKEDDLLNRVKAFVKRLLQVCSWQQPPFIAAVLVLVCELIKVKPALGLLNTWTDDSDDEHFVDVDEEDESVEDEESGKTKNTKTKGDKSSWVHRQGNQGDVNDVEQGYDALARNPLHSHVDNAIMWELEVLSKHFHPSVALFASQLLAGTTVSYTGNPLQDFTALRFLDRFVYRNPKQKLVGKESVMQPKSRSYKPPAVRCLPVNSKDFTSLSEDNVPIDEMFFHRFFTGKDGKGKAHTDKKDGQKEKKSNDGDDEEEADSEEGEESEAEGSPEADAESPAEIDSDASSVDDEEFDRILDDMEGNIDDADDDIDFAGEFQKRSVGKQSRKRKMAEDEDSSGDDDEDDEDDDEDEFGEEDDVEDEEDGIGQSEDIEGLDEEGFDMSDEDDDFPAPKTVKTSKKKNRKKESKKGVKTSGKLDDVTEQISSMIDENVGSKFDVGLNAMANKDKAAVKQLQWEVDRDRWVRGMDARTKIRAKKLKQGPKAKGFKSRTKTTKNRKR